jgi:hypothetical protein
VKQTEKLRRGNVDERRSAWTTFPNGHEYLLPVVSRHHRTIPVFNEDGSVTIRTEDRDPQVMELLNQFFLLWETFDAGTLWIRTEEAYRNVFQLLRRLIETNYEMTTEELSALLTVDNQQLSQLVEALFNTTALALLKILPPLVR